MFFSMIRLNRNASPRDIASLMKGDGYQVHRMVWNLFTDSPARQRDFVYRLDENGNSPTIYTLSSRPPEHTGDIWNIETKNYDPKITDGNRFSFILRANAVVTKKPYTPDENPKKRKRHDVVMEAVMQLRKSGEDGPPKASIVQEEGVKWLKWKAEKRGFFFESSSDVCVDSYQQHSFSKSKGDGLVKFSTFDFRGVLTVKDSTLFLEALYKGIGSAKGFGCGMLLIRRV
ncbi:MAG: type I-E CRISPR-associated protein Cas6/Cse3/CasE [Nitrospirae bacterium]|nr:type I-E CRISPR-associated protein Cas6/Cse3/CasE [Nitrospirota bacterium]